MGHPLIISYFTPGTAYEGHAASLQRSAERIGLDTRIEPRAARASWLENCAQKALFVQEIRAETDRPILWIDADAMINRPLIELVDSKVDLAVVKRDGWSFYGAQIYFGNSPFARQLIDRWSTYCRDYPQIWDQVTLGYAWWDLALSGSVSVEWLPETISAKSKTRLIERFFQRAFKHPAIFQKQESRRSKTIQAKTSLPEYRSDMLPEWWREAAMNNRPFEMSHSQRQELGLC